MRTILAALGTLALSAGLVLGGAGIASAQSDDHSDYSRHNTPSQCSERHSLNVNCNNIHVIELGNIL